MAEEEEQIIEEAPEPEVLAIGGPVYPIPPQEDVPPDVSQVAGNWPDINRFDGWVGEVGFTFYDGPAGGSPFDQDQAISVIRSDIKYDTNNDPLTKATPGTALTSPEIPVGAVAEAKPFPPRHDQAAYHVDAGDPVMVIPGKDNKNWYLADELPFVAEVTAVSAGVATVKRQSISGNPASAAPTLADLLDKDGSLVSYSYVKILKPNANYEDFSVGDTVLVQKRGRYYFVVGSPGTALPDGTVNARLGHDGTAWRAIRVGVAKIISNDGSGDYTIAEQIWDPDISPAAWINLGMTVTGDGFGSDGSPNGNYTRGGTYAGQVYYESATTSVLIWYDSGGPAWIISNALGSTLRYWTRVLPIEGIYTGFGGHTGNPVVAATTTLSARDISQNANGTADDFVLFWQQYDDNGDIENVILLATDPGPATDPFKKGFWFEIEANSAWATVDASHDYRNRFLTVTGAWDSGPAVDSGSKSEDDVAVLALDGVTWVAVADGVDPQRFIVKNTAVDHTFFRFMGTAGHSLGDFYLRVQGTTGYLQAMAENDTGTDYNVRVRISAGNQLAAATDTTTID